MGTVRRTPATSRRAGHCVRESRCGRAGTDRRRFARATRAPGWRLIALPRRGPAPVRLVPRALPAGLRRVLGAAEPPEGARLDRHRRHERALRTRRRQAPPMRWAARGPERTRLGAWPRPPRHRPMARRGVPLARSADPCEGRGRCDAPRASLGPARGSGAAQAASGACHYPAGGRGRSWRNG